MASDPTKLDWRDEQDHGERQAVIRDATTTKDNCADFPVGYLPMDCPVCGRRRLLYGVNAQRLVIYIECEKCGANSDHDALGLGGQRA